METDVVVKDIDAFIPLKSTGNTNDHQPMPFSQYVIKLTHCYH